MKHIKWLLALVLLVPTGAFAQTSPNFTQGSMNSTTVTETSISETIAIEKYGGAYNSWSGHNVTPSSDIGGTSTTYTMNTGAENWQLEITARTAGIIETQDITRTIETTSTTTSLSVFSQ